MALDLNGKVYSPGQIQQSVWDISDNALRIKVISGGAVGDASSANQEIQIELAEDTLAAIEALPATLAQTEDQPSVNLDFATDPVTTADYVEIVASCGAVIKEIEVYNGTASAFQLAFGAAASEVDQVILFPGGNGRIPVSIPAATRVSLKAINANASSGLAFINFYV